MLFFSAVINRKMHRGAHKWEKQCVSFNDILSLFLAALINTLWSCADNLRPLRLWAWGQYICTYQSLCVCVPVWWILHDSVADIIKSLPQINDGPPLLLSKLRLFFIYPPSLAASKLKSQFRNGEQRRKKMYTPVFTSLHKSRGRAKSSVFTEKIDVPKKLSLNASFKQGRVLSLTCTHPICGTIDHPLIQPSLRRVSKSEAWRAYKMII